MLEHETRSILTIDPGDNFEVAFHNIIMLRHQYAYNLTHIFQTHGRSRHTKCAQELHSRIKGVQVWAGDAGSSTSCFYTHLARDLVPVVVGEVSVCLLSAPGHTPDNHIVAVTHVAPPSTKVPALFTADTLLCSSVGSVSDWAAQYATLQRLRGFPGATLVFPGHRLAREDLLFSRTLDPSNVAVDVKLQVLAEQERSGKAPSVGLLPSTLAEERICNPYLMSQSESVQRVLREPDPVRCLQKIKLLHSAYFSR